MSEPKVDKTSHQRKKILAFIGNREVSQSKITEHMMQGRPKDKKSSVRVSVSQMLNKLLRDNKVFVRSVENPRGGIRKNFWRAR